MTNTQEEAEPSLLLLPEVSQWKAYEKTLEYLLPKLLPASAQQVSRLDIAIISQPGISKISRTASYTTVQKLLKDVYTLICICAARTKVELDFPGGIDARVFILDEGQDEANETDEKQFLSGPVIDMFTFVSSKREYKTIYSVDGERGTKISRKLTSLWHSIHNSTPAVQFIPCGSFITVNNSDTTRTSTTNTNSPDHTNVAVGGTFDHIHIGHKLLLTATIFISSPLPIPTSTTATHPHSSRTITIGITGDALLVNKKHAQEVESWSLRQQNTHKFIESILLFHPFPSTICRITQTDTPGPNGKTIRVTYSISKTEDPHLVINYTLITDPCGPTITDESITALAISHETRAGGKAVNDKRKEKGWNKLEVFEVEVLDSRYDDDDDNDDDEEGKKKIENESFEGKISSTEIRRRLGLMKGGSGGGGGARM